MGHRKGTQDLGPGVTCWDREPSREKGPLQAPRWAAGEAQRRKYAHMASGCLLLGPQCPQTEQGRMEYLTHSQGL